MHECYPQDLLMLIARLQFRSPPARTRALNELLVHISHELSKRESAEHSYLLTSDVFARVIPGNKSRRTKVRSVVFISVMEQILAGKKRRVACVRVRRV